MAYYTPTKLDTSVARSCRKLKSVIDHRQTTLERDRDLMYSLDEDNTPNAMIEQGLEEMLLTAREETTEARVQRQEEMKSPIARGRQLGKASRDVDAHLSLLKDAIELSTPLKDPRSPWKRNTPWRKPALREPPAPWAWRTPVRKNPFHQEPSWMEHCLWPIVCIVVVWLLVASVYAARVSAVMPS